ncbi:MAG: RecX family transcriptional regulator [Bacilli bacterium]|nr:RecX family transcriptional regulator [Bacilli bacterium]
MRLEKSGNEILKIKIGKAKVTLVLGNEEIKISPDTYTDFRLYAGKILSSDELHQIKNRDEIDKLLKSALVSVTKGHPTKKVLITKLEAKGANKIQIDKIIDILTKSGLIDDKQFVNDYLEYAKNKGYGQERIIQGLYEKGVPGYLIKTLDFKYEEELKRATLMLSSLEAKFKRYNYVQRRKRIYDSLMRLGYSSRIAIKVMEKIKKGDEKIEADALIRDYALAKRMNFGNNRQKTMNFLLSKGYRYKDIINIMEEDKIDEMD